MCGLTFKLTQKSIRLTQTINDLVRRPDKITPSKQRTQNKNVKKSIILMASVVVARMTMGIVLAADNSTLVVFEDWAKDKYEGWKVEGMAFGSGPIKKTEIPAYQGDVGGDTERVVNSHASGPGDSASSKDDATGKLTSRPFKIEHDYIAFWIGGGQNEGSTCLNLVVDGKVVRSATGKGDNHMATQAFEVHGFIGKSGVIEIGDAQSGAWGNIGVGKICFTDKLMGDVGVDYLWKGLASAADYPTRVVFEDWAKDKYEGWKVEGTAFGSGPIKKTEIPGYQGDVGGDTERVVNSNASAPGDSPGSKDDATGKLTSRSFKIEHDYITFWIGGGQNEGNTCLNLVVDGKVVRSATGQNSNRMTLQAFEVHELRGKAGVIEIVDAQQGAWGNIGVGKICFADKTAP